MSEPIIVRVFDIAGGPLCVSAEDGQRVYDKIQPLIKQGKKVALSFEQVKAGSAQLDAAFFCPGDNGLQLRAVAAKFARQAHHAVRVQTDRVEVFKSPGMSSSRGHKFVTRQEA